MTQKNKQNPLVSIGLMKFADKPAWQLAIRVLEQVGIQPISEGGLGWVDICVDASRSRDAVALLSKEPALKGKVFSTDHPHQPIL